MEILVVILVAILGALVGAGVTLLVIMRLCNTEALVVAMREINDEGEVVYRRILVK